MGISSPNEKQKIDIENIKIWCFTKLHTAIHCTHIWLVTLVIGAKNLLQPKKKKKEMKKKLQWRESTSEQCVFRFLFFSIFLCQFFILWKNVSIGNSPWILYHFLTIHESISFEKKSLFLIHNDAHKHCWHKYFK